ncbi:hypothetical protein BD779DRAFT_1516986 [Infundibulicybe gibba]|nr:hypothetical protein BD779DRAFT_1516986 [Infundibulicybe gibba]
MPKAWDLPILANLWFVFNIQLSFHPGYPGGVETLLPSLTTKFGSGGFISIGLRQLFSIRRMMVVCFWKDISCPGAAVNDRKRNHAHNRIDKESMRSKCVTEHWQRIGQS